MAFPPQRHELEMNQFNHNNQQMQQQQHSQQYPQANQYYGNTYTPQQNQPGYQQQYYNPANATVVVVQGQPMQNHHHQQPPHHHQQPQYQQQYQQQQQQQPYQHANYSDTTHFGNNPKYDGSAKEYDQSSIQTLIIQGEPMYSSEDTDRYPELKKFRKSGYQDAWAAILFLISFFGTVATAIYNGSTAKIQFSGANSVQVDGESVAIALLRGAGVGVGFSITFCVILLVLMRAAPKGFILVSNILVALLWLALAVFGFVIHNTFLGIVGIILAGLMFLWLYCVRNMIDFSALMLECSTHVVLNQFGAVGYALLALIIAGGYYVAWMVMVVPTLNNFQTGNNTTAAGGLSIIFMFMIFWAFQVFHNVAHVTSGGVMATWYFIGDKEMPAAASTASFVRSISTSFGSICFGSLIIAVLKTIEYMVRVASSHNRNSFAACIVLCILQCIESMARYFNRIAFSFISIFGHSYIESAKMTWQFVVEGSVWGTLINDILLERVFILANIGQAAIASLIVWFIFKNWVSLLGCILVSLGTGMIIFNVVDSASVTLMVASAVCPEVFVQQHPELRQKLAKAISELQRGGGCCNGNDDNNDGY